MFARRAHSRLCAREQTRPDAHARAHIRGGFAIGSKRESAREREGGGERRRTCVKSRCAMREEKKREDPVRMRGRARRVHVKGSSVLPEVE